jgi:hypothetical protein
MLALLAATSSVFSLVSALPHEDGFTSSGQSDRAQATDTGCGQNNNMYKKLRNRFCDGYIERTSVRKKLNVLPFV